MQSFNQEQERQARRCRGMLVVRFSRLKPPEARELLQGVLTPHPAVATVLSLETETDAEGRTVARVTVEVHASSPATARLFALAPLSTGDPRVADVLEAEALEFEPCP